MSIAETKEQIAQMPDDAILTHISWVHYEGDGVIECSSADLKALIASHTALLEAAKEFYYYQSSNVPLAGSLTRVRLAEVIQQAEET